MSMTPDDIAQAIAAAKARGREAERERLLDVKPLMVKAGQDVLMQRLRAHDIDGVVMIYRAMIAKAIREA